jgi:hypothetical protein
MEDVVLYRAFEAFCRQRAQMIGESSAFWLREAEVLAELIASLGRSNVSNKQEERLPAMGA